MGTLFNKKPIPDGWANPLKAWSGSQRAQGQRVATIDTKIRHLAYFARSNPGLQPEDVTVEYALAWSATKDWMPETRHGYYGSFKSFLVWMNQTTGQNRLADMPRVRRPRTKARPVPERVLQSVLTSHDPRVSLGSRLAASAGLRRSEIIVIHLDDFRDDGLGRSLLVHGKGGTDRLVPMADGLDAAIRNYVAAHHITGYLFPGECDGHIGSNWLVKLINQQLPAHGTSTDSATGSPPRSTRTHTTSSSSNNSSATNPSPPPSATSPTTLSNYAAPSTSPTRINPPRRPRLRSPQISREREANHGRSSTNTTTLSNRRCPATSTPRRAACSVVGTSHLVAQRAKWPSSRPLLPKHSCPCVVATPAHHRHHPVLRSRQNHDALLHVR